MLGLFVSALSVHCFITFIVLFYVPWTHPAQLPLQIMAGVAFVIAMVLQAAWLPGQRDALLESRGLYYLQSLSNADGSVSIFTVQFVFSFELLPLILQWWHSKKDLPAPAESRASPADAPPPIGTPVPAPAKRRKRRATSVAALCFFNLFNPWLAVCIWVPGMFDPAQHNHLDRIYYVYLIEVLRVAISLVAFLNSKRVMNEAVLNVEHGLMTLLENGTIRLVYVDWLVNRSNFIMRCQDMPNDAFVPGKDAAKLLRSGSVCVLSYRWLTKEHPDPQGFHLARVKSVFESGAIPRRFKAIFWEYRTARSNHAASPNKAAPRHRRLCPLTSRGRSLSTSAAFARCRSIRASQKRIQRSKERSGPCRASTRRLGRWFSRRRVREQEMAPRDAVIAYERPVADAPAALPHSCQACLRALAWAHTKGVAGARWRPPQLRSSRR